MLKVIWFSYFLDNHIKSCCLKQDQKTDVPLPLRTRDRRAACSSAYPCTYPSSRTVRHHRNGKSHRARICVFRKKEVTHAREKDAEDVDEIIMRVKRRERKTDFG